MKNTDDFVRYSPRHGMFAVVINGSFKGYYRNIKITNVTAEVEHALTETIIYLYGNITEYGSEAICPLDNAIKLVSIWEGDTFDCLVVSDHSCYQLLMDRNASFVHKLSAYAELIEFYQDDADLLINFSGVSLDTLVDNYMNSKKYCE